MAKVAAESHDVKKLEKMFKKELNEIEADKEMLETRLRNKMTEVKQLHMQYRNKEVKFITSNCKSSNIVVYFSHVILIDPSDYGSLGKLW